MENFAVHSRNGYYNGHIIHRVIKQFMIQMGDPQGMNTTRLVKFVHDVSDLDLKRFICLF